MKKIILLAAAMMFAMSAQVMAADDEYIWHEEFDDMSKWKVTSTNKTVTVNDGWLEINTFDRNDKFKDSEGLSQEKLNAIWKDNNDAITLQTTIGNIDISSYTEIDAEMKVVFKDTEFPEGYNQQGTASYYFPELKGKNSKGNEVNFWKGGLYYGRFLGYFSGDTSTKAVYPSGSNYYKMPLDKEFIWKITANRKTGNVVVSVFDAEGNVCGTQSGPYYGSSVEKLTSLLLTLPEGWKANIDYIRIKANGVNVVSATTDNDVLLDKNIRTDAGMKVLFTHVLDENTFDGIVLSEVDGEPVEIEIAQDDVNEKLYNINIPTGLKYGTEYSFTVSDSVASKDGEKLYEFEKTFTTETSPFYFRKIAHRDQSGIIDDIGNISNAESTKSVLTSSNSSGIARKIEVIRVVYNSKGQVIKVATDAFNIATGTKVYYTSEIDLTDLDAASMEFYMWDAFEGMHKIEE